MCFSRKQGFSILQRAVNIKEDLNYILCIEFFIYKFTFGAFSEITEATITDLLLKVSILNSNVIHNDNLTAFGHLTNLIS